MAGVNPIYYWDACIFLAWIKDEDRKNSEMDGVREVVERAKRRDATIVTSVLTATEVLSGSIPAGMDNLFKRFMQRINQISVDRKIAELAHDIRNHYRQAGQKTLQTPDAIHLATAILYRASEFHTFDENGMGGSLGLLSLSGNVAGHKLLICKPQARQPTLDLKKPKP